MSIWDKLFGNKRAEQIDSSQKLAEYLSFLGRVSAAGIRVNPYNAMRCHAVSSSLKVLTESVAQLPINVFQIDKNGRKPASLSLQRVIGTHGKPNTWQSSFDLREWATRHVALRGNAYFYKNIVRGELRELLPIHPDRVTVEQKDNFALSYEVSQQDGSKRTYTQKEIFHLRGPGNESFVGDDLVTQHAETIGLCIAQEQFAAYMFSNGVNNKGVLTHPGKLGDEAYKRLKESFNENFAGLENSHKALILEEDMKWVQTNQNLQESQLLDSRKLQRSIIASLWRVPPHMIGALENSTFSNIENLARQFVDYALMPWLTRFEQSMQLQLMSDVERQNHQIKFNANALLRGDAKTRAEFYNKLHTIAALNPNEIRELEDMNPYDGGDEFYRQQNMAPVKENPEEEDPDVEPAQPNE